MGNNASQSNNLAQRQLEQEQQWAHSFPRTPQRIPQQIKVLPDVTGDVHQKLRPTNNGEILFSGGTISGRHHSSSLSLPREEVQNGIYRSNSVSSTHPQEYKDINNSPKQQHFIPHIYQTNQMNKSPVRKHRNLPLDVRHARGHYSQQRDIQMKRFGSVPDLRGRDHENVNRPTREINKGRKKYKAPPPPQVNGLSNDSSVDSWEINTSGETANRPAKKTRLFKTRAEMKKKVPSPQDNRQYSSNFQENRNTEIKKYYPKAKEAPKKELEINKYNERNQRSNDNYRPLLSEMQRSKSLPEFQAELREATKKLRSTKFQQIRHDHSPDDSDISERRNKYNGEMYNNFDNKENKLKTLDHNICKKEHIKYKIREIEKSSKVEINQNLENKSLNKKIVATDVYHARKESSTSEQSSQKIREKSDVREQPSKTFYFGMDEPLQPDSVNSNIVDNFALSIQKHNCAVPAQTYSGSELSSETEIDDNQISTNGIALHLRPILPKKQLEIPRFSPAAAWKLLSAFDSNPPHSTVSDEGPVLIEDRIEKLARLPPPLNIPGMGPRSSHDKSGDSGISGDAGPPGFEDNSDPLALISRNNNIQLPVVNCPINLSWTPQQDLEGEEESSSECGVNTKNVYDKNVANIKFSPRSQVFSLSLPRDNHLATYMEEKARQHSAPNYTNLQRLKRSVSGVLNNFGGKIKENNTNMTQDQSNNWFLSRSAPNSLNNGFNSLEIRVSKYNSVNMFAESNEKQRISLVPVSSYSNQLNSNNGRLMYLPDFKENPKNDQLKKDDYYKLSQSINSNLLKSNHNLMKSNENISSNFVVNKSTFEPEDLQDPHPPEEEKWKHRKPKRFTFQSTVRQIERRRLAEKLSREAERKEQQRLSELEAMRRVEEEFQRKRAKEKASIRQQLRLFSLDDTAWSSLPPNWDNKDVPARSEPDGAVSSSASSPTLINSNKVAHEIKNEFNYTDFKNEKTKKLPSYKSSENKSNLTYKKILNRQSSESSDETKVKAQATQILSEYRQPRREYKDYRTSRCFVESNETTYEPKQTTVHPQVICNMPKAHGQGINGDNSSKSNNYRRDFAHGIMLPGKLNDTYPNEAQINIKKHSPRITQNQRTRQDKCIS